MLTIGAGIKKPGWRASAVLYLLQVATTFRLARKDLGLEAWQQLCACVPLMLQQPSNYKAAVHLMLQFEVRDTRGAGGCWHLRQLADTNRPGCGHFQWTFADAAPRLLVLGCTRLCLFSETVSGHITSSTAVAPCRVLMRWLTVWMC